jgi:lysophospholipase L1-like esterase
MKNVLTLAIVVFISCCSVAYAQAPFHNEIAAFKKLDSISLPPKNAIVFVGSSSFRMWSDVQSYFPGYTIINRGFGGSSLPDVIRYTPDLVLKYRPKQVLIYAGDNDLAASASVTADTVFNRFKMLFTMIRSALPKANIAYVSIKPSPSRKHLMPNMALANSLIKSFVAKQKNASFIDVYHPMLTNSKPKPEIFLSDSLHMNKEGYDIWQKAIKPYLKK